MEWACVCGAVWEMPTGLATCHACGRGVLLADATSLRGLIPAGGLEKWLPEPGSQTLHGIDRTGPTRMDMPTPPRSLLTRLSDAWRGMVNGWKGAL